MSDEPGTWHSDANNGITLPGDTATHNAGLSPLFIVRSGAEYSETNMGQTNITYRGEVGFLWSKASANFPNSYDIVFSAVNSYNVLPSHRLRTFHSIPLHCLVSTNNR